MKKPEDLRATRHHIALTISLLGLLLTLPVTIDRNNRLGWFDVLVWICLIAGVWATSRRKRHLVTGVLLLTVTMLLAATRASIEQLPDWQRVEKVIEVLMRGLYVVFFGYIAATILGEVLRARFVTRDHIYGTVAVYLLLGLLWGNVFALVQYSRPDSFRLVPTETRIAGDGDQIVSSPPTRGESEVQLIYFAFVSMMTVGYGDVIPQTSFARMLVLLPAIMGQFYIAVLVARMVGLVGGARRRGR
ncbi:MAG: potassium channel family protein [Candidatus Sumerlaeaceae bacterium]|nr:potassium channel family protein [Candidatus Sumerlaeaceae bacterium]